MAPADGPRASTLRSIGPFSATFPTWRKRRRRPFAHARAGEWRREFRRGHRPLYQGGAGTCLPDGGNSAAAPRALSGESLERRLLQIRPPALWPEGGIAHFAAAGDDRQALLSRAPRRHPRSALALAFC